MRIKIFIILILAFCFTSTDVSAQTPKPKLRTISAGIINGKAVSLPKPAYPAAAQALKAIGAVNVQVTIDEQGNVISATAVSGHPLLRSVSEQAARQAKFSPTTLSGQAVKVTGVIVYDFTANKSNEEKLRILGLATFLSMIRSSASDLSKLNQMLETDDMLKEATEEFADFAGELAPLSSLKTSTTEKRLEITDQATAAVRSKLTAADEIWQFDVGKNLGEFFALFLQATSDDKLDLDKLNASPFRLNLANIKTLTHSAPPEIPVDVLEKLKYFAAFDDKKQVIKPEDFAELWEKLGTLLETISPGSSK